MIIGINRFSAIWVHLLPNTVTYRLRQRFSTTHDGITLRSVGKLAKSLPPLQEENAVEGHSSWKRLPTPCLGSGSALPHGQRVPDSSCVRFVPQPITAVVLQGCFWELHHLTATAMDYEAGYCRARQVQEGCRADTLAALTTHDDPKKPSKSSSCPTNRRH